MSFYKKNINVKNYFIRKEFIVFRTNKASFINLPNHNRHIGFWLSNKFIYFSEKHSDQVAIGLIYNNSYPINHVIKSIPCPPSGTIIFEYPQINDPEDTNRINLSIPKWPINW